MIEKAKENKERKQAKKTNTENKERKLIQTEKRIKEVATKHLR